MTTVRTVRTPSEPYGGQNTRFTVRTVRLPYGGRMVGRIAPREMDMTENTRACASCGNPLGMNHRSDCVSARLAAGPPMQNTLSGRWISYAELNALKAQLNEARELGRRLSALGKAAA